MSRVQIRKRAGEPGSVVPLPPPTMKDDDVLTGIRVTASLYGLDHALAGGRTVSITTAVDRLVAFAPFDHHFYSQRYMLTDASRADAALHFLKNAFLDSRTGSPAIDAFDYSRTDESRRNGFVRYAFTEAHHLPRAWPDRTADGLLTIRDLYGYPRKRGGKKLKVALVIHLFYPEFLDLFLLLLSDFPGIVDLYVTCPDEEVARSAEAALLGLKKGKVLTKAVPNVGRNFAPLLIAFGDALREYDCIGHVHTKKSLYTGQPRTAWALHAMSGVIGNRDHVTAVLAAFESQPTLGVVASEPFYDTPYWAAHWLRNADVGARLAERLGLAAPNREFVEYPVGGMFWICGTLFRRLLDLKLSYVDFPPENGQTDGTLHHALERIIGPLAQGNNMRFLRYSPRFGDYCPTGNDWTRTYKTISTSDARGAIALANVCSFDLFDTLISRDAADADEAKYRVAFGRGRLGEYEDYRSFRNAAELKVREGLNWAGDARLIDIASQMSELAGLSISDALALLQEEITIDGTLLHPRRALVSLYDHARSVGKRIIIVSDSFYSEQHVHNILAQCGIGRPDQLYISSELGLRKDRGDLWKHISQVELFPLVHFGDSIVSDVQGPSDVGAESWYVCKAIEKAMMLGILTRRPTRATWPLCSGLVHLYGDDPYFS